jgi:hypothetical protein
MIKAVIVNARDLLYQPSLANKLLTRLKTHGIALTVHTSEATSAQNLAQELANASIEAEGLFFATAEVLHFPPSEPAHYAEIVARVGVEPDEMLVAVADDRTACSVGLVCGITLQELQEQLEAHPTNWRTHFTPPPLAPSMLIHEWLGNLGALNGMIAETRPSTWHQHPVDGEWSIVQILSHLVYAEAETHRPRLLRIAQEENPFIIAPKPPPHTLEPLHEDALVILEAFEAERKQTIALVQAWLQTQPQAFWLRKARHSIFGITNLLEMAHFTAQHDRLHINQLCQTIGRCEET